MAKHDPQALCERLFTTFLAPLVLGGSMTPGKPIGGKNALSIGEGRTPSDADLVSRAELARVRVARRLAPVDLFEPGPTGDEWAIAAALHDLVQAAHPGFDGAFRRSGPARILSVVEKTLARIPPPTSAGDALSRHSWFSRIFELARTDIEVKWWTGKETFLGTDPPARLLAWPELRRVEETRTPRPLMDLPASGAAVDAGRFASVVEALLTRTPLTDLATMTRPGPPFLWSHATLALVSTRAGHTMALRALALLPDRHVDTTLGRATRVLFEAKAPRATAVALDVLRDRAIAAAESRISGERNPEPLTLGPERNDASFAISAGALVASHWLTQIGGGFAEGERKALLDVLKPAATSGAAQEIRALFPA